MDGTDAILDRLTASIARASAGFTLLFAAQPFPGYQAEFVWLREELGGNWYHCPQVSLDGWLCPALFKYFDAGPPVSPGPAEGGRSHAWCSAAWTGVPAGWEDGRP